jgi:hypothetical protein
MKNYYQYWYKKFIKQGLKQMKLVVGLGISFVLGDQNLVLGILFLMFVLLEALIERD